MYDLDLDKCLARRSQNYVKWLVVYGEPIGFLIFIVTHDVALDFFNIVFAWST